MGHMASLPRMNSRRIFVLILTHKLPVCWGKMTEITKKMRIISRRTVNPGLFPDLGILFEELAGFLIGHPGMVR
jgi:hypothetical protein